LSETPQLYRVILQVSDLDQAADFYTKLLGTEGRRIYGGFRHYFDCGSVILALVDPSADNESARPNPDNIYFSVKDLDSVHARARDLACLSTGDVHGEPAGEIVERPWGERSFYAFDPFGNPICFVDESTVFTGR
jgi:catechol 2,3-dioxygenase-like lactoylglutathione lyase family enzyme